MHKCARETSSLLPVSADAAISRQKFYDAKPRAIGTRVTSLCAAAAGPRPAAMSSASPPPAARAPIQYGQYSVPTSDVCVNFGVGQPAPSLLPLSRVRAAAAAKLAEDDPLLLQYGFISGYPAFRRTLADFLSPLYAKPVDPELLFVTSGISGGLALIVSTFLVRARARGGTRRRRRRARVLNERPARAHAFGFASAPRAARRRRRLRGGAVVLPRAQHLPRRGPDYRAHPARRRGLGHGRARAQAGRRPAAQDALHHPRVPEPDVLYPLARAPRAPL